VRDLIVAASAKPPTLERAEVLAFRVLAGYVIGLRRLKYGRATLDDAVGHMLDHVFD